MQNVTARLKVSSKDSAEASVQHYATLRLPVQGDVYLLDTWSITSGIQDYNILNFTSPWPNGESAVWLDGDRFSFPPLRESVAHGGESDALRATASQWIAIYNNAASDKMDKDHKYRAIELLWHFCVNTYKVTVEGGKPISKLVATSNKVSDGQGYGFDRALDRESANRNFTMLSASGDSKFSIIGSNDYRRLDVNLRNAFEGAYSSMWTDEANFNEFSRGISQRIFAGVEMSLTAEEIDKQTWSNLELLAAAVSDSLTDS